MNRIVFLGSGGGRHMIASQTRKTGGLYFEFGDFGFCVDPGPGALVNAVALGLKPEKWKGLLISHYHIDHANDANAIIDAMVNSEMKSKYFPFLIAEEHCLKQGKGRDDPYPYITKYHQGLVKKLCPVVAGDSIKIDNLEIRAVKANHYTHNVGFVLACDGKRIGYAADGSYYPGQEKAFEGCDVLVLNVQWPKGYDAPKGLHMTLDDAIALVRAIEKKPKLTVLTHFSPFILRANLFKQERIFRDATKTACISASDFMELDLDTLRTRILQPVSQI